MVSWELSGWSAGSGEGPSLGMEWGGPAHQLKGARLPHPVGPKFSLLSTLHLTT